jgi:hypothetical protein
MVGGLKISKKHRDIKSGNKDPHVTESVIIGREREYLTRTHDELQK